MKFIVLSVLLLTPSPGPTPPLLTRHSTGCAVNSTSTTLLVTTCWSEYYDNGEYGGNTGNFWARYLHGNIQKQKGIVNMQFNIISLRFKVAELKQLIKNHNPHIFGISESELKKERVEENTLKIPGYDILFPKSWSQHGYARVVVYVKKTFKYQQVAELEDDHVQSVWLKGGQRNCKEIFFCHSYREHLSKEGSAAQHNYLNKF